MNKIKVLLFCLVTSTLLCCAQKNGVEPLEFLDGIWKIEGREVYESWAKQRGKLTGKSYKLIDGTQKVSETLEIKSLDDKIIYTATVFNQNEGKGIPFTLNINNKEWFSFENMEHDFPNKVQYKMISKKELQVSVVGKDGKGFSYKLLKQ